jgi:hypothetical protein
MRNNLGFSIKCNNIKTNLKKCYLRENYKDLTPEELLVFLAYQVYSLREIAKVLKKSHTFISRIYIRAYAKIKKNY